MLKHDMPWINLRDPKEGRGGLIASYSVTGMTPSYVMISPEGKIVNKWEGYGKGHLKSKVSEILK
jgi:hypothetical protein